MGSNNTREKDSLPSVWICIFYIIYICTLNTIFPLDYLNVLTLHYCSLIDNCTNGDVRLVDGTEMEGYVEVCIQSVWGTISDRYIFTAEANAICRQLGYTGQCKCVHDYNIDFCFKHA